MKKKRSLSLLMICATALFSCQQKNTMQEYKLTFSMEAGNSYKAQLSLDQTGSYQIRTQNIYMDRYEDKDAPIISEGVLDSEELLKISQAIEESGLMQMKEDYGFNNPEDQSNSDNAILYQLALTTDGKEKLVTIRDDGKEQFSANFIALLKQLTTLITEKQHKKSQ